MHEVADVHRLDGIADAMRRHSRAGVHDAPSCVVVVVVIGRLVDFSEDLHDVRVADQAGAAEGDEQLAEDVVGVGHSLHEGDVLASGGRVMVEALKADFDLGVKQLIDGSGVLLLAGHDHARHHHVAAHEDLAATAHLEDRSLVIEAAEADSQVVVIVSAGFRHDVCDVHVALAIAAESATLIEEREPLALALVLELLEDERMADRHMPGAMRLEMLIGADEVKVEGVLVEEGLVLEKSCVAVHSCCPFSWLVDLRLYYIKSTSLL